MFKARRLKEEKRTLTKSFGTKSFKERNFIVLNIVRAHAGFPIFLVSWSLSGEKNAKYLSGDN